MINYKITVAYDGTKYKGWQVQKATDDTIQGKLQHVLSTLCNRPIEVIGSGRTDAGVHARGQVANFHFPKHFTKDEIFEWLNRHLPSDIAVLEIEECDERFHSRYNAKSKTYVYTIHTGIVPDVFGRKYKYNIENDLDIEAMRKAASYLIGEHDFKSFCGNKKMKKSTVRNIFSIDIKKNTDANDIVFVFTGNGFLQNMIRILMGTLIEVGDGRRSYSQMPEILEAMDRNAAGYTAPACGLMLLKVEY